MANRSRVIGVQLATMLALAVSAVASAGLAAQSAPSGYRQRLLGVYDPQTGAPIEGAQVIDVFAKTTALTTKTGTVSLAFLAEGGSMVRIQAIGYEPHVQMIVISPDDTLPVTVLLTRSARPLPAVVTTDSAPHFVSPGLQGFEERRRTSVGGHFIDEAELRKHDTQKLTDIVRVFPGMTLSCSKVFPNPCYAVSLRQRNKLAVIGGPCYVDIYVNGAVATDNDLETMRGEQFAAIEFYAGGASAPQQYNKTGSTCGVMLLWTRER